MRWIPLEANPDVLNKYVYKLGLSAEWQFIDVWSLDDEMLSIVPQPVVAVVLLFPCSEKVDASPLGSEMGDSGLIFMKQTIGNACGTMAVLHAVSNNIETLNLKDDSYLRSLIKKLRDVSPDKAASLLEEEDELSVAHEESAQEGQTEAPQAEANTKLHFVAFVANDNKLFELDGRRGAPVTHDFDDKRVTNENNLLQNAAVVIKRFMERDPTEVNFNVMALCRNSGD